MKTKTKNEKIKKTPVSGGITKIIGGLVTAYMRAEGGVLSAWRNLLLYVAEISMTVNGLGDTLAKAFTAQGHAKATVDTYTSQAVRAARAYAFDAEGTAKAIKEAQSREDIIDGINKIITANTPKGKKQRGRPARKMEPEEKVQRELCKGLERLTLPRKSEPLSQHKRLQVLAWELGTLTRKCKSVLPDVESAFRRGLDGLGLFE